MLLAESESDGFHDDHKCQDEELVDQRRGVILGPQEVVGLEQEQGKLDGDKQPEIEYVYVEEQSECQVIIHVADLSGAVGYG